MKLSRKNERPKEREHGVVTGELQEKLFSTQTFGEIEKKCIFVGEKTLFFEIKIYLFVDNTLE